MFGNIGKIESIFLATWTDTIIPLHLGTVGGGRCEIIDLTLDDEAGPGAGVTRQAGLMIFDQTNVTFRGGRIMWPNSTTSPIFVKDLSRIDLVLGGIEFVSLNASATQVVQYSEADGSGSRVPLGVRNARQVTNSLPWTLKDFNDALTDAATIAVDVSGSSRPLLKVTLGGNRTMGAPSNAIRGRRYTSTIIQDATGGRTLAWDAVYKHAWSDAANTAGKRSQITFEYDGTNTVQLGAQTPYV